MTSASHRFGHVQRNLWKSGIRLLLFVKTCGEQSTDQTKMDIIEKGNLDGTMGHEETWFSCLSNFDLDVPLNRFLANAGTFGLFTVLLIKVSVDQFYENHDSEATDTLGFESGAYFFLGFFSFSKFCDDIYTLVNFKPVERFFYNFWRRVEAFRNIRRNNSYWSCLSIYSQS